MLIEKAEKLNMITKEMADETIIDMSLNPQPQTSNEDYCLGY
jgi:hypothetical protein